jgi:hypothetical protein
MGFLGLSYYIWGIIGVTLAVVFAFIAPREQGKMSRTKYIIVRWFHSLVWILLAISFFLRGTENLTAIRVADIVALAGGVVYIIYFVNTVRSTQSKQE